MKLLYEVLADNPGTSATLLTRLYLLADRAREHGDPHREGTDLLKVLARNPNLPQDLRTALEQDRDAKIRRAVLERPGMTAETAIRILAGDRRVAVWRHAVRVVDDPAGHLAQAAIEECGARYVYADLIASTKVSEDMRIQAAALLARALTEKAADADVDRVLTVAKRHKRLAEDLHTDPAVPQKVKEALAKVLDKMGAPDSDQSSAASIPGTTAALTRWLAEAGRSTADVLAYLATGPKIPLIRQTITEYRDPTGQIPAAALAHTRNRNIALAALLCPEASTQTRRAAARIVLGDGRGLGYESLAAIRVLLEDADFASEVAASYPHRDVLIYLLQCKDLTAAAVTALASKFAADATPGTSPYPAIRHALWVATMPAATRMQRAEAADRIRSLALEARVLYPMGGDTAWAVEWARAGQRAATASAGEALATLPCKAVRDLGHWTDLPGAIDLFSRALSEYLADLDDESALTVLTSLAADFTGTLGELVDTVAAVAGH